jgi:diguanylate cyclase (GGDEF)-like protein
MHHHPESDPHPLREQLESLLHFARINEEKMQRMDAFERQLIASCSLLEVFERLLADYPVRFELAQVSLSLIDPDGEILRIMGSEVAHAPWRDRVLLEKESENLNRLYGMHKQPRLEMFEAGRHAPLFSESAPQLASVALLPLRRNGRLIGSLHLGSADVARYTEDCGTKLLERLADIIAVCIESALAQERLKQVGLTDGLTGVQNRRYFEHRCLVEISQSQRYKHALACMFLDLDKFKRINDTHGHQTGDEVLRKAAALIQSGLRAGDTIARYGGEEFVVLLPQTSLLHAKEVAERIRTSLEAAHFAAMSGHEIRVTLSIGLSMLSMGDTEQSVQALAQKLVSDADQALYLAKENGRNRVVVGLGCSPQAGRKSRLTQLGDQYRSLLPARLQRLASQIPFLQRQIGGLKRPSASRR